MKKYFLLSCLFILITVNFAIANVPAPILPKQLTIKLQQNYSDYVFYLCRYSGTYTSDTNAEGYRIIKVEEDTFAILPIKISVEKPFVTNRNAYEKLRYLNLVAVRKDVNDKIKSNIVEKLLNVVRNQKDEDGIYESYIKLEYKYCRSNSICDDDFENYSVEVESLSEKGLKFKGFDKAPRLEESSKTPASDSTQKNSPETVKTCFAGIFLTLGITIAGMWFLRKNKRK